MAVRLKRAYEQPEPSDGYRVLIDRLWPRGLTKELVKLEEWAKELAPCSELRRWFGHDPAKFDEFRRHWRASRRVQGGPGLQRRIDWCAREYASAGSNRVGTVWLAAGRYDWCVVRRSYEVHLRMVSM